MRVNFLKPMKKICLVNKILVSPFDYCLQVLVGIQVESVSSNEPNTKKESKGFFSAVVVPV